MLIIKLKLSILFIVRDYGFIFLMQTMNQALHCVPKSGPPTDDDNFVKT